MAPDGEVLVMRGTGLLALVAGFALTGAGVGRCAEVGFGKADITPDVRARPVWIAGYGNGRQATGVHDAIESRAIVLKDGERKVALVSVDLIGVQLPLTEAIRKRLPGFDYVLVGSTHNHEGPDVIGLWGPTEQESGVDGLYLKQVEEGVVASVLEAERSCVPAVASYGEAEDESLMADSRLPIAKDGVLRAIRFESPEGRRTLAILVQFSCHPEDLESKNTLLTSDFPHYTRQALEAKYGAPVAYFTGMVGGLMTGPEQRFKKADGSFYEGGDWEFARVHGEAVAELAVKALGSAETVAISPMEIRAERVMLPLANEGYRMGRAIGVLPREAYEWKDDPFQVGKPLPMTQVEGPIALQTEVAYLRLGDVHVAGLPGEIYPELIYGKYQEPVEPNVDFPEVTLEPPVMSILPGKKVLLLGLANDEIGYVLPKRQWDQVAPFAYGRDRGQYGEVNSVGPEAGPILMEALRRQVGK